MAAKSIQQNEPKDWKSGFAALKYVPRFFKLIWETNPRLFIANILCRSVKSILPILLLWVGKLIIDEVIIQVGSENKNFSELWIYLGIELGLAVLSDILSRSINLTDGLLGDLYANKSSVELIQKTATVQLNQLEDAEFYDKLERARRQTTGRVTLMSNILGQAQDLITVISLITGLIVFAPALIILLIISIIPSFINEIKFSKTSYSLVRSWTQERRELDYLRFIGASDETAKEIKLFGLADFIAGRFSRLADEYYQLNKRLNIKRSLWGSLFHLLADLAYYGAYLFIIIRTVSGLLTVGDLTFLSGSFNRLRNQLQTIFNRFSNITENALYLKDYFDFIDLDHQKIMSGGLDAPSSISKGIVFEKVGFKYPGNDQYVLRNISFTLQSGEKLALVGENGAGKTTLIKLLLRMYQPTEGRILLEGKDIQLFDQTKYQELFGVIFQDFVKYYFTAADNIAVGKVDEIDNFRRIQSAAELSLADKVIESLPEGYDQQLGRRFYAGKDLSGGEWQKIGLARAYMKDAEIIILDEPTSALDARAESETFKRFIGLTEGKTSVIISHRFSTVRMADRILVLKNGEINEMGTHQELVASGQLYAELFKLQAKGYLN